MKTYVYSDLSWECEWCGELNHVKEEKDKDGKRVECKGCHKEFITTSIPTED